MILFFSRSRIRASLLFACRSSSPFWLFEELDLDDDGRLIGDNAEVEASGGRVKDAMASLCAERQV